MNELLLAIGFVLILEGAPYLLFPRVLPRIVEFLSRADPLNLRLLGGFMIAVGLLMVYWVRTYA
ncbi:MAG: DUF2065 domain-containing protein [Acidobacteriota bacterium]|nr:DUF2065 domain-containing protein [Acidobacteriota bacterium]